MGARRQALQGVKRQQTTHPGLWLDRFLELQTDDPTNGQVPRDEVNNAKSKLVSEVAGVPMPVDYRAAFHRWQALLESDPTVRLAGAACLGRVIVGLGAKGAAEVGIRLDPTWGVPALPGSALKGLAASAAHKLLADDGWSKHGSDSGGPGASHAELFGTTDEQGLVHFLDAWWVPDSAPGGPLHPDVMTSHHPDYYTGSEPPADTDSPVPVAFLTASGRFLVAVQAADPAWRDAAMEILAMGLRDLGIGAKTNAGYGRLEVTGVAIPAPPVAAGEPPANGAVSGGGGAVRPPALGPRADPGIEVAKNLAKGIIPGNANDLVARAQRELPPGAFLTFAAIAIQKLDKAFLKKKIKEAKPWALALQEAAKTGGG